MNNIFLQAPAGGGFDMIIMLVLMAGVFYFFMIRPQIKKQKEQKKFREELTVGSQVVTLGGIHGKIHSIQETTVNLKVEDKSVIKVEKSALVNDFSSHVQQGGRR